MKKISFITGVTGQDGSYLAELLLSKGYEVHGLLRYVSSESTATRLKRIAHIAKDITFHDGSLESYPSLFSILQKLQPDEIFHLGAQSFVSISFADCFSTVQTNINGTMYMLEATRLACPKAKFYFASSSEQFGKVLETPQTEKTPFYPRSPYGITKCTGFEFVRNYREAYGMFCCSGILFNHESPRRGEQFVTRKITQAIANIAKGLQKELRLGNLEAQRDWGHARDYVAGMHMMLQQDKPDDYVLSTGETHSVREFCDLAFKEAGISDWEKYVVVDPKFYRPAEVDLLLGDASKAKIVLGWSPTTSFESLVKEMVNNDLSIAGVSK